MQMEKDLDLQKSINMARRCLKADSTRKSLNSKPKVMVQCHTVARAKPQNTLNAINEEALHTPNRSALLTMPSAIPVAN